jgi:hypothetical protein
MSVWKNITKNVLICEPNGPGKKQVKTKPGAMLNLEDDKDYLIGTQIDAKQVQKWDPETGKAAVDSEPEEDEPAEEDNEEDEA